VFKCHEKSYQKNMQSLTKSLVMICTFMKKLFLKEKDVSYSPFPSL